MRATVLGEESYVNKLKTVLASRFHGTAFEYSTIIYRSMVISAQCDAVVSRRIRDFLDGYCHGSGLIVVSE